ncbi:hypothetical protein WMQ26_03130 [Vibrio diabolicus]|uniref:hypothetical protein n=1 Tax=Vibrio diabolicus TaxID=50719 RepID=UPI00375065DE
MRNKYNWKLLSAEFQLASVKYPDLSMAAFAKSRGIPASTFRKAIRREQSKEQKREACMQINNYKLAMKHIRSAICLLNNL